MNYSVKSSGLKSATAQIVAGSAGATGGGTPGGMVHGVTLIPDGTNASNVVVYNDISNTSGTEVVKLTIPASTTAPQTITFNHPVVCPTGIRAVLGGTGGNYIVWYSLGS